MELAHLGDAADHWKGSVIGLLEQVLNRLHVLPLLTDAESWTSDYHEVYARLLRVERAHILQQEVKFTSASRSQYFAELLEGRDDSRDGDSCDLFLDPNTGIKTANARENHVGIGDIDQLLHASASRMLLIYKHGVDRQRSDIAKVRQDLHEFCRQYRYCAYYNRTQAGMVFVSRSASRIEQVRTRLSCFLGPVAPWRIIAPAK